MPPGLLAAAGTIGLAACASTSDPATGDLRLDLAHRDPRVRIEAAVRTAEEGRTDLAGALIGCLEDRDESVRFVAAIALRRLTGRDFGYLSFAAPADRADAVARWRRWLAGAEGLSSAGPATAAATPRPPGEAAR